MLVWLDLETTGLDPQTDDIIEVSVILTDDSLNEISRFDRVVYSPIAQGVIDGYRLWGKEAMSDESLHIPGRAAIHPKVVEMHMASGLWYEARRGMALKTVDEDLAALITAFRALGAPQLAGSTISFDRGFLAAHMPKTIATLHHRNVDVTTFNETARRFWPEVHKSRPGAGSNIAHRGMADIESSIAVYKHYLAHLGPKEAA